MPNASVPSFAKINLDLRVLHKRPDGYHELRTVFQTITLKDGLSIRYDKSRQTSIELESSVDIPDNLVVRAARLVTERFGISGHVRLALHKQIPMGAGLGGGSSNAAAVLLALPALAGKRITLAELTDLAETLGSDVPFFLRGGTAVGLGRGGELYPIPEPPSVPLVLLTTGIHVSTPAAYQGLNRTLTEEKHSPILIEFQTVAWSLGQRTLEELELKNDFEESVFRQHPQLPALANRLRRFGARPALMTGSGSALFGVFPNREMAKAAAAKFPPGTAFVERLLSRARYVSAWRRALGASAASSIFGAGAQR